MRKKKQETVEEQIEANKREIHAALNPIMGDATEKQLEPVEVAAQTMLGDLMKMTIDLAKALPKSWQELSEKEQDTWLNSVEAQCRGAIRQVVQIIASEGHVRIPVQVKSFKGKDAVELQCELVRNSDIITFLEADTKVGMLVLANSDAFTSEAGKPKAQADQRALELGGEYNDADGDGMDGEEETHS